MHLVFHVQQRAVGLAPVVGDLPVPLQAVAAELLAGMPLGMVERALEEAAAFQRLGLMVGFEQGAVREIGVPEYVRRPGAAQVVDRHPAGLGVLHGLEVVLAGLVKALELLVGELMLDAAK